MGRIAILRIGQSSAVTGCLILIIAVICLVHLGIRSADRLFHKLESVALIFLLAATICGVKYSAVAWRERPDKQQRLRLAKLLVLLLIIMSIPMAVMNWFYL